MAGHRRDGPYQGDFFRQRFGPRAELLAAVLMIPGYTGWIAAQFVALAGVIQLAFGVPLATGILLVALVGLGYTLIGGMWSVTLTDCVQVVVLLLGLLVLAAAVLSQAGGGSVTAGLARVVQQTPPPG